MATMLQKIAHVPWFSVQVFTWVNKVDSGGWLTDKLLYAVATEVKCVSMTTKDELAAERKIFLLKTEGSSM